MISTLTFTATSHPIQLPPISEGLGAGILINVWVCRTGRGGRQRILDLVTANGTHLFVGTGGPEDSLTVGIQQGTMRREVLALGVLPLNRWVKVSARVWPELGGFARLEAFDLQMALGPLDVSLLGPFTNCNIGGGGDDQPFVGSLSGLEIYRMVASGWGEPLKPPILWARYPLNRVTYSKTVTTASGAAQYYAVDDTSTNNHDGLVEGELQTLQSASLGGTPVPVLVIPNEFCSVRLSPVQGLAGKLTLETWLSPVSLSEPQAVLSLGDDGDVSLAMTVGGNTTMGGGNANLMLCQGTQQISLVEGHSGESAGVFQHLAVTFVQGGMTNNWRIPITVSLFLNGQLNTTVTVLTSSLRSGTGSTTEGQEYLPLFRLLNAAMIPEVMLGGSVGSLARFKGRLSEVRIWNTCRAAPEIASTFLSRLVGNESGILACYRLEQRIADCVYDISAGTGIGKAPQDGATIYAADGTVISQDFTIGTATNLPLQHTSNPADSHLNVQGKLVTEYLVYNTPSDATEVAGPVTVFDATLEPVRADGSSSAGDMIQVCPDWDTHVYLEQPTQICLLTLWKAKTTYNVAVPLSGKLRLRFKSFDLWFRTVRARSSDMPVGVWTLVRPDHEMQANLAKMTGATLLSPPQGKASPLPAGTTAESAEVCASVLGTLGDCYRPSPNSATFGFTRSGLKSLTKTWKKSTNWLSDAASSAGSTVQKLGSEAGQFAGALVDNGTTVLSQAAKTTKTATALVCHGSSELTDLIHATANAVPRFGTAQIVEAIGSADRLAFVSTAPLGAIAHSISIIGTTIINGTTYVWRVVAAGWANAVRAMSEFCKKIGASIQKMIELLAWLFNWKDFLAASDGIYNNITGALGQVPTLLQTLSQYKDQILTALTVPTDLPKKSLSELCGLSIPDNMGAKEMDYVMELGQKLMSAADIELDGLTSFADQLQLPTIDTAKLDSLVSLAGNVASPGIRSASGLLTTPVNELVGGMNSATGAVLDFVFASVGTITDLFVKAISTLLTGRISVPRLSGWIESTILGGRQLNLLRIVSLAGGIFEVLMTKIAASATAGQAKPQAVSFADSGGDGGSETKTGLLIANFVISFLGSLIQALRLFMEESWAKKPVAENQADPNALTKFGFDGITGVLLMVRSSISMTANEQLPVEVRSAMDGQAACEGVAGGAMILWGMLKWAFSNGKNASWLKATKLIDMVLQLSFGVGALIAAAVAGSHKSQFDNQLAYSSYGLQASSYVMVQFVLLMNAAAELSSGASSSNVRKSAFMIQLAALTCDLGAAVTSYASNQVASS